MTVAEADQVERARDILARVAIGEVDVDRGSRELLAPISGGAATLMHALRELDDAGIAIGDVGLRRPTLDDVFLTLTGHHTGHDDGDDTSDENTAGSAA